MCYSDGGPTWRKTLVCPSAQAQYRLDCGKDDYFAVKPRRGSWLARNPQANIANSRFLAKVAPRPLPIAPALPTGVVRDHISVRWLVEAGVRYDVGVVEGNADLRWLVQDSVQGYVSLIGVPASARVFVRAVNDAGYSPRARATLNPGIPVSAS
jgi:hypothetical protein